MKLSFRSLFLVFTIAAFIACSNSSQINDNSLGNNSSGGEYDRRLLFSAPVADPCQFKNLSESPSPVIERVFSADRPRYESFQREYLTTPEIALKNWLMATPTFTSARSIDDFEFNRISERGAGHAGIYEVHLIQHPEHRFILKVSTHESEAEHLWKLQNSIAGHPECLLRTNLGLSRVATQEELAFFPKIPRVLEAANFPFDSPRDGVHYGGESATHRYPILMEKVAGQALASLNIDQPETLNTYRTVGKSLGYFHYFMAESPNSPFGQWATITHGDLHANNVFFDRSTNSVSFIDNDSMDRNNRLWYDFYQLGYLSFDYSINTGHSVLAPYLTELQNQEAGSRGMPLASLFDWSRPAPTGKLHPQDAIIGALERHEVIQQIPHSPAFQEVAKRFSKFRAVAQGYSDAFPENRRHEVREYFGQLCRNTAKRFIRDSFNRRSEDEPIEPRLNAAIRHLFPSEVIACMDENRFE